MPLAFRMMAAVIEDKCMGLTSFLKPQSQIDEERAAVETAREKTFREEMEKAQEREAKLRLSTIPGYRWEGTRLVRDATEEVVAKIDESDTLYPRSYACVDYAGPSVVEWTTTDGKKFVKLDAAKRHQESLM